MKRRFLALAAALTVAVALMLPVSADVIWTPENRFYEMHREECEYIGRTYEFRGYEGSVPVFDAPDGKYLGSVENGGTSNVQFLWQGEQAWGYVEQVAASGWVPMDDLSLVYDSQQFMEEHADRIQTVEPTGVDEEKIVIYEYPYGPRRFTMEEYEGYQPFEDMFAILYTDESGLRWGYVGYYMGRVEAWVCLDDPLNEDLSTSVVETQPSAAQLRGTPSVEASGNALLLPAVLVFAVVVVTAALIRKLCPQKKR